jgi:hypothetical protein
VETNLPSEFCGGNGIRHIVASVGRPSTIEKIEAWMYPKHKQFVDYWNNERQRQGLSYPDPADANFTDLKRGTSQLIEQL